MTSTIFLAAFLGCLLALSIVSVAVFQIAGYYFRKLVHSMHGGAVAKLAREGADDIARVAGSVGRLPVMARCRDCRRTQSIPDELALGFESAAWLSSIGWFVELDDTGAAIAMRCPMCNVEKGRAA